MNSMLPDQCEWKEVLQARREAGNHQEDGRHAMLSRGYIAGYDSIVI